MKNYLISIAALMTITLACNFFPTNEGVDNEQTPPDTQYPSTPTPIDRMSYFTLGHSLFNWDGQVEPGSTAESSTGYWLGYLSAQNTPDIGGTGQFAQLDYATTDLWPQWGFTTNEFDPWPDDTQPFSDQDFTHIFIMPSNYHQREYTAQGYIEFTGTEVTDFLNAQEPDAQLIVYEHYPEPPLAGSFSDGANLSDQEWQTYRDYTRGEYHDWFIDWQNLLTSRYPNSEVRMIPLGPIKADLIENSLFDGVSYQDLYADDAPHGTRNTYFLLALITYRALIGESPTLTNPLPSDQLMPQIIDNYQAINEFIEDRLDYYNENGVNVY